MIGGDIILAIEDEAVNDFDDLISFLDRRGVVGETISLTIMRNERPQVVDLTLDERPSSNQLFRP